MHREHDGLAPGAGLEVEVLPLEVARGVGGDRLEHRGFGRLARRQPLRDRGAPGSPARPPARAGPASTGRRWRACRPQPARSNSGVQLSGRSRRRTTAAALRAAFPRVDAQPRLQRVTGDLDVVADEQRQLGVEQLPLLALVRATSATRCAAAPRAGCRGWRRGSARTSSAGRLLEPQAQLPVGDIGLEQVALQPRGVRLEPGARCRRGTPRARRENRHPCGRAVRRQQRPAADKCSHSHLIYDTKSPAYAANSSRFFYPPAHSYNAPRGLQLTQRSSDRIGAAAQPRNSR